MERMKTTLRKKVHGITPLTVLALFLSGCQGGLLAPQGDSNQNAMTLDSGEATPIQIDRLEPTEGSALGGNILKIHGKGFRPATVVFIGDEPCKLKGFLSNELLTCVMPIHAPGVVSVRARNFRTKADGREGRIESSLKDSYTYLASQAIPTVGLAVGAGRSSGGRFVMDAVIGNPGTSAVTNSRGSAQGGGILLKAGR
jgi:hypothetical protein